MKSLEDILEEIKILKSDSKAEIVLQEEKKHWEEEKGHWEDDGIRLVGGGISVDKGYEAINERYIIDQSAGWVIDKRRITKPNEKKRDAARLELQKIYESSEWYSLKYAAGIALSPSPISIKIVDSWFAALQDELTIDRKKAEQDLRGLYDMAYRGIIFRAGRLLEINEPDILAHIQDVFEREGRRTHDILNEDELKLVYTSANSQQAREKSGGLLIDKLAESKRIKRDLESLKETEDELKDIYRNSEFRNLRRKAGKVLGYSELRIFAQVHPVAATLTGIAYIGLISGLVYYIYHIIE